MNKTLLDIFNKIFVNILFMACFTLKLHRNQRKHSKTSENTGKNNKIPLVQPPTQSRVSYDVRPSYSGLYPVRSWKHPHLENTQPLQATCPINSPAIFILRISVPTNFSGYNYHFKRLHKWCFWLLMGRGKNRFSRSWSLMCNCLSAGHSFRGSWSMDLIWLIQSATPLSSN